METRYIGKTRPTNAWRAQVSFPSEDYESPLRTSWYDVHGRKAAALGRKWQTEVRISGKDCDVRGNRVRTLNPWLLAKAWVEKQGKAWPTAKAKWAEVDRVAAVFAPDPRSARDLLTATDVAARINRKLNPA